MHQFTPIRILLIEDNIRQWGVGYTGSEINVQYPGTFPEALTDTDIPAVRLTGNDEQELGQYFSLLLLQHPEEIREYMTLIQEGHTKHGAEWMGTNTNAIPDAIVFDYLLGDHLGLTSNKAIAYNAASKPIREWLNPNIYLQKKLSSNIVLRLECLAGAPYSAEEFVKKINGGDKASISNDAKNLDLAELKKDIMGLYGGISIRQLFSNHPVAAIPATQNYAEADRLNTVSKFYEWLFEPELGALLSLTLRSQKNWDAVVPKITSNLRERILMLARQNAISFNLDNLLNLASGQHTEELKKQADQQELLKAGFWFSTPYGTRCFNLAALFVDYHSVEERNNAISTFGMDIYELLSKDEKLPTTTKVSTAIANSDLLFKAYQSETFWARMLCSKLYWEQKSISDKILKYENKIRKLEASMRTVGRDGEQDKENLAALKFRQLADQNALTNVNDDIEKLKTSGLLIIDETGANPKVKHGLDIRDVDGAEDMYTSVYTILFTILRLYRVRQEYLTTELPTNYVGAELAAPGAYELLYMAFPIPSNPVSTDIHTKGGQLKRILLDYIDFEWDDFCVTRNPNFFSPSRKMLLTAFAQQIGLNRNYFPHWLHSKNKTI